MLNARFLKHQLYGHQLPVPGYDHYVKLTPAAGRVLEAVSGFVCPMYNGNQVVICLELYDFSKLHVYDMICR